MGMNVAVDDDDGEDSLVSAINTTPLVDVMLVLLIIFLITIPVAINVKDVRLPKEENVALRTKPENVNLSVTRQGEVYWNDQRLADERDLLDRLQQVARQDPQPVVHIRGDLDGSYEGVGRVVLAIQRAGMAKVGFVTEPAGRP
jgi:biopolymer transport protein ExbD